MHRLHRHGWQIQLRAAADAPRMGWVCCIGVILVVMLLVGCAPVQPGVSEEPAEPGTGTTTIDESGGSMPPASVETPASVGAPVEAPVTATVAGPQAASPPVEVGLHPDTPDATATSESSAGAGEGTTDDSAGLAVYRAQYCGVCHVLDAAETRGTFGPTHNGMGAIAAARIQEPGYSGDAETGAGYLRESIVDPKAYIVPGYAQTSHAMPVYSHLPEEDVEALVHFLLAQ